MSDRKTAKRVGANGHSNGNGRINGTPPTVKNALPLEPHELSLRLPAMSESQYQALKSNVLLMGKFTDPVMRFQGRMLDGNNRQRVSIETGIGLVIEDFDGTEEEAEAYVLSKAVRRNLTASQRACAAVNFLPFFEKQAVSRMISGGSAPVRQGSLEEFTARRFGKSCVQAGEMFEVGGRYVQMAKTLRAQSPQMFDKVISGQEDLARAARVVLRERRVKERQAKLLSVKRRGGFDAATLILGNALAEMPKLPRRKFRAIFFDPPYNLGFHYDADPTGDHRPEHEYLNDMRRCFDEFKTLLTPDGAVFVMISEEHVDDFGVLLRKCGFHKRRLIVWYESFGEAGTKNFGRTCRFIWYFVVNPDNFVFDETALLTKSKRQTHYNDKRAMPGGKVIDSLWDFSRVCGTFNERVPDEDVPTQLPEELCRLIVAGFTDPGDEVLDPMCGTGSMARACARLHRRFTGIDRSKKYIAIAKRELALMIGESQ